VNAGFMQAVEVHLLVDQQTHSLAILVCWDWGKSKLCYCYYYYRSQYC